MTERLRVNRAHLDALLQAQNKMLNQWAESDEPRRRELWRDLHHAAERIRDAHGGRAGIPPFDGLRWRWPVLAVKRAENPRWLRVSFNRYRSGMVAAALQIRYRVFSFVWRKR